MIKRYFLSTLQYYKSKTERKRQKTNKKSLKLFNITLGSMECRSSKRRGM